MKRFPAALIFDMDGVLINSEPLWRIAMIKAFAEFDMPASDEECRQTMGMRIKEVILLWLRRYRQPDDLAAAVEKRVMDLLLELIEKEGRALEGVHDTLDYCRKNGIRCGLATSSSRQLMHAVLDRLQIRAYFDAAESAEGLRYGKPHPEVFLRCADALNCEADECLVIEDSLNGVIAARAAGMHVIAVPDDEQIRGDVLRAQQFSLAQYRAAGVSEALIVLKNLRGERVLHS